MDSYRIRGAQLVFRRVGVEVVPINEQCFIGACDTDTHFGAFDSKRVEVPDGEFIVGDIIEFPNTLNTSTVQSEYGQPSYFRVGTRGSRLTPVARGSWLR